MGKYILSIDGGGLRGLIPTLVLAELSRRLDAKAGRPVELARVFDLIAATGTGGLIAAGLASPRVRGADAQALGPEALAALFRRHLPKACKRRFMARGPDDGVRLETLLDEILPPTRLGETRVPVLFTACDPRTGAPASLTSPAPYEWVDQDWFFRQAVRATMATPGVFEPTAIQNALKRDQRTTFVGGEVWAADPTTAAITEAFARDWEHDGIFVLSLGVGEATDLDQASPHALAAQANAKASSLHADQLLNRGGALQYSRIDGALGAALDPYDGSRGAIRRLEAAAKLWIAEHDKTLEGWAIRLAARVLVKPAAVPVTRPAEKLAAAA
jgi:patatin-like phospholipase/acyl hydrolase